jgi:hypothetical protein
MNYQHHLAAAEAAPGDTFVTFVIDSGDIENGAASNKAPDADLPGFIHARSVLNLFGVRMFHLDGDLTIGVWSDLDGLDIRAALNLLGHGGLPVRYLDGAGIPVTYAARMVAGEPVPLRVLTAMIRNPEEPWRIRDRMLTRIKWRPTLAVMDRISADYWDLHYNSERVEECSKDVALGGKWVKKGPGWQPPEQGLPAAERA